MKNQVIKMLIQIDFEISFGDHNYDGTVINVITVWNY